MQRARPNLGIFIVEQGVTSVESLLKGATAHESLRTTVLSDTDKSCQLIPESGERNRASPSKFTKTCSVVNSVEYISWVRPFLLSKIKS